MLDDKCGYLNIILNLIFPSATIQATPSFCFKSSLLSPPAGTCITV